MRSEAYGIHNLSSLFFSWMVLSVDPYLVPDRCQFPGHTFASRSPMHHSTFDLSTCQNHFTMLFYSIPLPLEFLVVPIIA